jgi:signal transduction histidine kinase
MLTEPIRRTAMERARDENIASLSGKVLLVQEDKQDVQNGTILYVPVYQNDKPISTVSERRAALRGWVNSPYRMKDLMQGILGEDDQLQEDRIHFMMYDDSVSEQSLLYNSAIANLQPVKTGYLTEKGQIDFNGKKWVMVFDKSEDNPFIIRHLIVFLCIGGILFSLLLFLLALSLYATEQRAQEIARKLTLDLRSLSEHLINIREKERTAIAKEIHDQFSQNLVALSMNASWLKNKVTGLKENEKAILDEQIQIANEVIGTSRTLYNDLHPAMLEEIGLAETIKWYAHKQLKFSDMRFVCLDKDTNEMEYNIRLGLFRIFQESLTNILQHARATSILVHLVKEKQTIRLSIQDNGVGFKVQDHTDSSQSLGLLGIRERVYALKGNFSIQSEMGKGTTLTITVPV